jgi:hypothetical protein
MTEVLALSGGMLRVSAARSAAGEWFDVRLDVSAPPFSGTVESAWFDEEMASLRDALAVLAGGVRHERAFEVDGHRGATLRLVAEPAVGGGVQAPGELALRVWLTPSGDDPSVVLQFDTFEPPETFARGLARLETLLV